MTTTPTYRHRDSGGRLLYKGSTRQMDPRWSPKADPDETVPAVEVDLRRPYALGMAIGAAIVCCAGLIACLYRPGDLLVQALTAAAFLTCLAAAHLHKRRTA